MDNKKQKAGISRYAIAAFIGILVFIFFNSPSKTLVDEVNSYSKSVERAEEEEILRLEESFVNKLVKNDSYPNAELLALALKEDTSTSAQSALYLALDERGFKFSTQEIQDYMIARGVSSDRGRLTYIRFLRDSKTDIVKQFVKRNLSLDRKNFSPENLRREHLVCWRLAHKKFPSIISLKNDPEIGKLVATLPSD